MVFKKLKLFGITVFLLLWIIGFVTITDAMLTGSGKVDNASHLKLLLNVKNGTIWRIGIEGEESKLIKLSDKSSIVDYEFDHEKNRILWLSDREKLYSKELLSESNGSFNSVDNLLLWYDFNNNEVSSSRKITVDPVNEKIYSFRKHSDPTIEIIDLAGKHRNIVLEFGAVGKLKDHVSLGKTYEDLNGTSHDGMLFVQEFPLEIVLDPFEGYMFIRTNISGSSRIHRAHMDGTSLKEIVQNSGKVKDDDSWRLAIDQFNKRIYWSDYDKGVIESAEYDGSERLIVVKAENPVGLSIRNNYLFWSQNVTGFSSLYVVKNTLSRARVKLCKLSNNTCHVDQIRDIPLKNFEDVPLKLKAVSYVNAWPFRRDDSNICSTNKKKGMCQQLCLVKHSNSSSSNLQHECSCNIGYRLASNLRDCDPVLKYLVYESNNYLKAKPLDPLDDRKSHLFPSQSVHDILEGNQIAGMDFNPNTGKLLYMDCVSLIEFDLNEDLRYVLRLPRDESDCYKDMAYDWKTKKLYTTVFNGGSNKYTLKVFNFPEFDSSHLLNTETSQIINQPLSLVVHHKTGFVYLLTIDQEKKSVISRMMSGGLNSTVLNAGDVRNVDGLAIDNQKDRLYWFTSAGDIQHSNLDGGDIKSLPEKSPVQRANFMIIDDERIYIKNLSSIWLMNKENGDQATCILAEAPFTKLRSGMKIVERSVEQILYGPNYQITKAACRKMEKISNSDFANNYSKDTKEADVEFCKSVK